MRGMLLVVTSLALVAQGSVLSATNAEVTFPGNTWEQRSPEVLNLSRDKLDALRVLVGGRGCVISKGFLAYSWGDQRKSADVASAMKPVISTLLLMAVRERKLAGVDDEVVRFEPRLKTLNGGKDAAITWRQLASQTSGYGLSEAPGKAYAYNDFAIALYYDSLTRGVFQSDGNALLKSRIAEPLQFEDAYSFEAFGPNDRPGRLAVSVRDFARFGLMYLRGGKWRDRRIVDPALLRMAVSSPVPATTPLTRGVDAEMLPRQRTIGGGRNITPVGPGYYSFNWWLNGVDARGHRLFPDAPADAFLASGHGGKRALWVIPSLDLVVSWNDSSIEDHDVSPGNPESKSNQALRLIVAAAVNSQDAQEANARTTLAIQGASFTLNGRPTFLHGISYYGALGADEKTLQADLDWMQKHGFNWIRVWATWAAFDNDVSAVDGAGRPREQYMRRLKDLVAECDRRGMVVDVTLSRGNGVTGPPRLQSVEAHRRALESIVTALKAHRNWYLDVSNERNIDDKRFTSFDDLEKLRARVREIDPARLVTASHAGDIEKDDLRKYLMQAGVDFIAPHRPRDKGSAEGTEKKSRDYLAAMKEAGRVVPLHYQEPFRRAFGDWNPKAADFVTDAKGAKAGGAAGWCLHNGDSRERLEGRPRRSFDLRDGPLFEQLDKEESQAVEQLAPMFRN